MKRKMEKDCVNKIILDSVTLLIIIADIIIVWGFYWGLDLNLYYDVEIRFVGLFVIVPIIQIINLVVKNKLSNILLIIYEVFLAVCNLMQFSFIHYESDFVSFALDVDAVFDISYMSDLLYYATLIFVQPLTISIAVFIIAGIIVTAKKHG